VAKRFIGEIYFEQNDYENALKYFLQVYSEFEFDPVFLHHLVIIYTDKKDTVNAQKYIRLLQQVAPDFAG
jgi:tetratricopeptide (TPR) repeat protein